MSIKGFNPIKDSSRPKKGEIFEANGKGKKYAVKYVSYCESIDIIMKGCAERERGCDKKFFKEHPTNPNISWVVWANEVKEKVKA